MVKLKIFLAIAGLTIICFIIGLYAGGWAWYALTGYPDKIPSLMTLFDLGKISLTDKSKIMLPWAWAVTAVITFLPTGITLFIFLGGGDKGLRSLHGNARFANKRELKKIWYTEPEK
ncbi:hypothetical protein RRJ51_27700 (plasmid) [Klebsiella pneumoniae]|uniref:hypothetical protein n=1 Tax=Klebsiella pneumoniae TaxID=573 RepID=UPI0028FC2ED3|nr:hypothetical protein [Klebsiella pneumoniae]WNV99723.1 hypothetical protein RRJ51_27700 [Klebsiella pneumoniae]